MRIGHGYDAHRFCDNKKLMLGGIAIDFSSGLLAQSDGDVVIHALIDALLGAAGQRDIGYQFPPTEAEYKDIDSRILLRRTAEILEQNGLIIEYADMTIVAQVPRLSKYIDDMRTSIADVLQIPQERLNIKATTEEKMGFTGRCEGISSHAVCLLASAE